MNMSRLSSLRMPAEWSRHARTIMAWPSWSSNAYRTSRSLAAATDEVSSIAEAVAQFEPVTLLVATGRLAEARQRFDNVRRRHQIRLHPVAGEGLDLWMRDIAPTFVVDRGIGDAGVEKAGDGRDGPVLRGVDFNFYGWGNRAPAQSRLALAQTFLRDTNIYRTQASIVTEGGALEVDGEGTLLATESSIINQNRNPGKSRDDIEAELKRYLGISKVLWVPGIKDVDVTDYHIDALARFARPGVLLLSRPAGDPDTLWARVYEETRDVLSRAVDAKGRALEMIDIPEPDPSVLNLGEKATAAAEVPDLKSPVTSYVNYFLINGGVVVPQFGDKKADEAAMAMVREVFGPERQAVGVFVQELPSQGGGIHCATQQIPCLGL